MPANQTSFKTGNIPHNKKPRYDLICKNCNNIFKVFKYELENRKTCSKKCTDDLKRKDYTRDTKATTAYNLALQGKTIAEISQITGFPKGSISSYLNKLNFRRFANGGQSYSSIKKKLLNRNDYKSCCICGFNRIIEVAHIIPASKGGDLTYQNTLPLCPNHHHLFDNKKLTTEEELEIKKKWKKDMAPARSRSQFRLMKAIQHNPKVAKKFGMSQEQAAEYTKSNVGKKDSASLKKNWVKNNGRRK
jgi:hypothetical protein